MMHTYIMIQELVQPILVMVFCALCVNMTCRNGYLATSHPCYNLIAQLEYGARRNGGKRVAVKQQRFQKQVAHMRLHWLG